MQKKNLHNYGDIVTTTKFQLTTIEAVVVSSHGAYYYSLMDDQEGILRNENEIGFYFSGAWPDSGNAYQFSIYDFRIEHVGARHYIEAVIETRLGRTAVFEILKRGAVRSIDRLDSQLLQHADFVQLGYLLDKPDTGNHVNIVTTLWTTFEKLLKNDHFCDNLFIYPEQLYAKKINA
jgi:hypothetical protein